MVKTLLSTHAHMYTRTNTHVRTRMEHTTTNILLAASSTVSCYEYTKDVQTPTWYTRSVRGVDSGDSRQVGTASRPLICFGLSTVHYIDEDNDFSFFIFPYLATR